jgi:hypothetical protein
MIKQDELPTVALADLANVTGGAGDDMSAMLPMMMMMRNRSQPAPAAPAPWKPKILVNGVEQSLNNTGNGSFSTTTDPDDEAF